MAAAISFLICAVRSPTTSAAAGRGGDTTLDDAALDVTLIGVTDSYVTALGSRDVPLMVDDVVFADVVFVFADVAFADVAFDDTADVGVGRVVDALFAFVT